LKWHVIIVVIAVVAVVVAVVAVVTVVVAVAVAADAAIAAIAAIVAAVAAIVAAVAAIVAAVAAIVAAVAVAAVAVVVATEVTLFSIFDDHRLCGVRIQVKESSALRSWKETNMCLLLQLNRQGGTRHPHNNTHNTYINNTTKHTKHSTSKDQ